MFGENFKKIRNALGYTQEQIADRLNVSQATIHKWEQEKSTPSPEMLVKISTTYSCSIDMLITGKEFYSKNNSIPVYRLNNSGGFNHHYINNVGNASGTIIKPKYLTMNSSDLIGIQFTGNDLEPMVEYNETIILIRIDAAIEFKHFTNDLYLFTQNSTLKLARIEKWKEGVIINPYNYQLSAEYYPESEFIKHLKAIGRWCGYKAKSL